MVEEVLFDALLQPPLPSLDDDAAVTHRFVRASMPYEAFELCFERRFVKTVPAPAATVPYERVWFDEDASEIDEPAAEPKQSWWWLVFSLLAGAAAVLYIASY